MWEQTRAKVDVWLLSFWFDFKLREERDQRERYSAERGEMFVNSRRIEGGSSSF